MHFNFVPLENNNPLISSIWQMTIDSGNTPYKTPLISTGETFIVYNFNNTPNKFKNKETVFNMSGLSISGQIYGTMEANYLDKSYDLGIIFKPTAFYKLFNVEMAQLTNNIIALKDFNIELYHKLNPIFLNNKFDMLEFKTQITNLFNADSYKEDKKVSKIDEVIEHIKIKEGNTTIEEILDIANVSKKTLENHFKKMIGLTPAKYIRQLKFTSIIRKYQTKDIDLNKVIKELNYYDSSHFYKDFQLFTGQTPKVFFGANYPLVKSLLS